MWTEVYAMKPSGSVSLAYVTNNSGVTRQTHTGDQEEMLTREAHINMVPMLLQHKCSGPPAVVVPQLNRITCKDKLLYLDWQP